MENIIEVQNTKFEKQVVKGRLFWGNREYFLIKELSDQNHFWVVPFMAYHNTIGEIPEYVYPYARTIIIPNGNCLIEYGAIHPIYSEVIDVENILASQMENYV